MAAYTPILFAQDIRRSAYRLPDTAQGFLCQARSLRLYTAQVGGQTERLKHGVQWFIASMACALRPRVLTRVIMADASLVALGDTMEEGAFIPDDWISMFGLLVDALPYQVYTELMLEIFMPFTWWLKSWYSGRTTPKSTNPPAPIEAAIAAPVESQTLFLPSMDDSISDTSFDTKVKVHTKKRSRSVLAPIPPQSRKRVKREDGNQPTQENFSTGTPSAPAVTPLSVSLRVNRLLDSGAESPQKQSPQKISTRSNNVEKLIKQVHQLEQPSSPLVPDVWRVNSLSPLAVQSPVFAPSTPSGNPSSSGDPDTQAHLELEHYSKHPDILDLWQVWYFSDGLPFQD
ncbi:hypothetical protein DXG01_012333 [Tephrocybe rancida]|nr:hypothetical protein DXG01_012333 [Tephrocybe rancida]